MRKTIIISSLFLLNTNIYANTEILFVCGGNTGRSVMAEYYTNKTYSSHGIQAFSRGSSIDPLDDTQIEQFAKELIIENHEATDKETSSHRATPISIIDIYHADIILTMGTKYNQRLYNLIDRECSDYNLNYPYRNFNKEQWYSMCNNKQKLKDKVHTVIGCATGVDSNIDDAYGHNKEFYIKTRNILISNVDKIVPYFINNNKCPN